MNTSILSSKDVSDITYRMDLAEKTEKYYRDVIELAKENDIPIIVIVSPYAGITDSEQAMFNRSSDIAKEYDVSFVNTNLLLDEICIDYSTDVADRAHLNYKGNQKFTVFIGRYLLDRYYLFDHRGDIKYDSWKRHADYIRQIVCDQELLETRDVDLLFNKIINERYWIFVSLDGTCNTSELKVKELFGLIGISEDEIMHGIWFFNGNNLEWCSGSSSNELYKSTSSHDFLCERVALKDGTYGNKMIIDNDDYKMVENGINVIVYDVMTEKVVDSFGMDSDKDFELVRKQEEYETVY